MKYVVSETLFSGYYLDDAKDLTRRKDLIVSNDNKKKLGIQKELGKRMIATKFDAKNKNWLPPCYYVPKVLGIVYIYKTDSQK